MSVGSSSRVVSRLWRAGIAGAVAFVVASFVPVALSSAPAQAATARHPLPAPHGATAHALRPFLTSAPPDMGTPVKTFTVNTPDDTNEAPADLGTGVCKDAAGNCSLRAALEEANAEGSSATPPAGPIAVVVPAGTYDLTLGSSLLVTDPSGVVIQGAGAASTVVSAKGNTDRVLLVAHATSPASTKGAQVVLSGITLEGGTAPSTGSGAGDGGGIAIADQNDVAVLDNVTVSASSASNAGGGIVNNGELWMTSSTITGNSSDGADGGCGCGGGLANGYGAAQLTDDTVSANTVSGFDGLEGGGIANFDGTMAISGGSITANTVMVGATGDYGLGGGLYADDQTTLSGVTVSHNTIGPASGFTNTGGYGGGIDGDYGLSSITNSTIADNTVTAVGDGGAFGGGYYEETGTTITGSTFSANTVQAPTTGYSEGGGLYSRTSTTASGTTFSANQAINGNGGGVSEEGATFTLRNDMVVGNSATGTATNATGNGGGLSLYDTAVLTGTLVTANSAQVGGGGAYVSGGQIWSNDTFSHNTANLGGGVYNSEESLTANAVAIVDNTATGTANAGGGIYNSSYIEEVPSALHLSYSTLSGNVADQGAGIFEQAGRAAGELGAAGGTMHADTIAGNTTPAGVQLNCTFGTGPGDPPAPFSSLGGNVEGNVAAAAGSCGLAGPTDRQGDPAQGYWEVAKDGGVFAYNAGYFGSMAGTTLAAPIVGMATMPGNQGYWEVGADGGVFAFGAASFYGSMGGKTLNAPIVAMTSTPDGKGYWLVASDGGVFAFGDAGYFGSMGGKTLNKPIVGIAATPDGNGYWLVASDGGVFAFGDAAFYGSMGAKALNKPVVGIMSATDGEGYALVAADGGVFAFGSALATAPIAGAITALASPIVGGQIVPGNSGYWLFAADGGAFAYDSAPFHGSAATMTLAQPVVGGTAT